MTIQIRDSTSWKTVSFPYVRGDHYDGTSGQSWLPIHTIHIYDGNTGLWKEAFRNTDGNYIQQTPNTYYSNTSYTVEQGVRFIKFTVIGASGGGAGGTKVLYYNDQYYSYGGNNGGPSYGPSRIIYENYTGGSGGPGQQFDTLVEVIPGEVYTMSIGSLGQGGNAHDARAVYGAAGSLYQNVSWSGSSTPSNPRIASVGGSNGGSGGNTTVLGSARSVNIRAYGGNGGIAASGTVSHYYAFWQDHNGDHQYGKVGSFTRTGPSNSSGRTSDHHLQGTQANGAVITKTNDSNIIGGTGGAGGSASLTSGPPSNGTNGIGGSVKMTLYKKVP